MPIPSRIAVTAVVLGAVSVPVGIGVALDITQDQAPVATTCVALVGDEFAHTALFFGLSGPCAPGSLAR